MEFVQHDIIAEGLMFPEGPIALDDGSVLLVEILRGALTRVWGDGRSEVVADVGGGPNGAALGPDGAVYITNNGGFAWSENAAGQRVTTGALPRDYRGGRIERVDLATGRVECLYDRVGEHPLKGPNDLVFDDAGGMWFTDFGRTYERHRDLTGIYYAAADGSAVRELHLEQGGFNGIGLSPDGKRLYVAETFSGKLLGFEITSPGVLAGRPELVGRAAPTAMLDSLAVLANGDVCVGTIAPGGISCFPTAGGEPTLTRLPDRIVTNLCFGGEDMRTAYVTCSGSGRLLRTMWPTPGLKLNH